jgi:predicted secreted protein
MNVLQELFKQRFGELPTREQPLQGQLGGSGRNIIRLSTPQKKTKQKTREQKE